MKLVLLAKSSSGDPYRMNIDGDESGIRIFCHCPAGSLTQLCKHKIAIAKGDSTMLADPAQVEALLEMQGSAHYPALKERAQSHEAAMSHLEKQKSTIQKEEKALKAQFAQELLRGVKTPATES
ncbi:MAG: hypothetical protein ABIP20_21085 [Chthoniobacteraceae bacterium]